MSEQQPMTIENNVNPIKKKGGFLSFLKKEQVFGLVFLFTTYAALNDMLFFQYLKSNPAWLLGYAITLLLFLPRKLIEQLNSEKVIKKNILMKILWFLTSPYFAVVLLIVLFCIISFQIIGYMAVSEVGKVKEIIYEQMGTLWNGMTFLTLAATIGFSAVVANYPFKPNMDPYTRQMRTWSEDNVHAMGIMWSTILIVLFFTVYFTVEFETKFNIQ
tara:strand:- start:2267 stop:2914 length:648 start_codon:yes stop_codon:yes gene_type:complete